jgi:hypothetical protein
MVRVARDLGTGFSAAGNISFIAPLFRIADERAIPLFGVNQEHSAVIQLTLSKCTGVLPLTPSLIVFLKTDHRPGITRHYSNHPTF